MGICLSLWRYQQTRPVRELLATVRRLLPVATRDKEVSLLNFVHQTVSAMVLIIFLVIVTAICRAYCSGAWPCGTLLLLIVASCLSALKRLLMAPMLAPIAEFVQRCHW